jgi:DNA-binding GntR family transcriptional regulator
MQLDALTSEALAPDRRVLHEAVAERLRALIVDGVLAPGAHLNERVLCEQLGVSRTPLREAFRTLAGEGIVALQPNRGAVVAALSRQDVEHAFELMAALESLAGGLAAERATATERDELRALHFEMLAAHARRDLPAYYRLNSSIHRRLVDCARNPVLADTYARLTCESPQRQAAFVVTLLVFKGALLVATLVMCWRVRSRGWKPWATPPWWQRSWSSICSSGKGMA